MVHPTERKGGTTTVEENVEDRFDFRHKEYGTFDALYEEWTGGLARMMMWRLTRLRDATDEVAFGVLRDDELRALYLKNLAKIFGEALNDAKADIAWKKVTDAARSRYLTLKMRASSPPLPRPKPAPVEEPPIEAEPIPEAETAGNAEKLSEAREALSAFCASGEWHAASLDRGSFDRFNAGFFSRLAEVLNHEQPETRAKVAVSAKELYRSIVWPMYRRANQDEPPENAQATFEAWLDKQWPVLLDKTKLYR
jgi:hypothetical protein